MSRVVRYIGCVALLAMVSPSFFAGGAQVPEHPEGVSGPWPADVPGFVPVKPGEHPRLLFRKTDLPELRKRAETPQGKAIIERIKMMLEKNRYTTWHASGYAFLYLITEDKEYLDEAQKMIEWTFKGRGRNPDGRYTWPGDGQLRGGPCLWGLGLAYDLGYNGWDEAYRKYVIDGIVANHHFDEIPNSPAHGPGCNHYGAHTGGAGSCHLALRGDPELGDELAAKVERNLEKLVNNAEAEIVLGYGPRGYYYEGHHCGRLSSNSGLIPFIQSYRTAAGKDLVRNCSNAQWLSAKWIYELYVRPDGTPGDIQRGMYCGPFNNSGGGMSGLGDFALGFGIIPDRYKASFLWTYNNTVQPALPEYQYDVTCYPIHGIYAFVNWPRDIEEQNPKEILPLVRHDPGPNYFLFRNGWTKDGTDLIVTALLGSRPRSGRGMATGGSVSVGGRGLQSVSQLDGMGQLSHKHFYLFPGMFHASRLTYSRLATDGSGVISGIRMEPMSLDGNTNATPPDVAFDAAPTSLAVDFSKASGCDLLVAMTGPQIGYAVGYWMQIVDMKDPIEAVSEAGWRTRTVYLAPDGSVQAGASGASGGKLPTLATQETASLFDGPAADDIGDEFGIIIPSAKAKKFQPWYVMLVTKGQGPKVEWDGKSVKVGGQTLTFDGEKIVLAKMGPELKLEP
jgi:hypothetical protein